MNTTNNRMMISSQQGLETNTTIRTVKQHERESD